MHGAGKDQPELSLKSISYTRVLSLSRELHPGMPTWPDDPRVEFQPVSDFATHGYFSRQFSMGEHSGTHINAPNSFHPGGKSIDQYLPESLVVPAVVIDVSERVRTDPDYGMTVGDLEQWEERHGILPAGAVVLLRTDWQSKWSDAKGYLGTSKDGSLHFPGFSVEAAQCLLNDRHACGLGVDSPGVEPGIDTHFTVNRLALEEPRIVLENLCNLEQLPATGVTLAIGALPLRGGTGSPVSVLAFVP